MLVARIEMNDIYNGFYNKRLPFKGHIGKTSKYLIEIVKPFVQPFLNNLKVFKTNNIFYWCSFESDAL